MHVTRQILYYILNIRNGVMNTFGLIIVMNQEELEDFSLMILIIKILIQYLILLKIVVKHFYLRIYLLSKEEKI
jgi:hypothetical protein